MEENIFHFQINHISKDWEDVKVISKRMTLAQSSALAKRLSSFYNCQVRRTEGPGDPYRKSGSYYLEGRSV